MSPSKAAPTQLWCKAALTFPGWDGTGQHGTGGQEAQEETTIAQPQIGLGTADAQPHAMEFNPVAFHRFIHGLFSLSPR